MSTTLADQLKRLSAPQSSILTRNKTRVSFLFDAKEAAKLTAVEVFQLGQRGFEDLVQIDTNFEAFRHTLFSKSVINFERTVHTKKVNEQLDKAIRKFLLLLSPYYLLQSAHQALEWLIYRFYIHEFNKDDVLALILPYHETNYFVRFLQLMKIYDGADKWNWLHRLQKGGVKLPKSIIINHCCSNVAFLKFVCDMTVDIVKENDGRNVKVAMAFFCTVILGTLEHSTRITEPQLSDILPALLKGFSSNVPDFVSSSFIITGYLFSRVTCKKPLVKKIIKKIVNVKKSNHQAASLLVLIYQTHFQVMNSSISIQSLQKIIESDNILDNLNELNGRGIFILPFVVSLLKKLLKVIQTRVDVDDFMAFVGRLNQTLKFDDNSAALVIRISLDSYELDDTPADTNPHVPTLSNQDEIKHWYYNYLKQLETQHPIIFDRTVITLLQSKTITSEKREILRGILAFLPTIQLCMGSNGYGLFDNLNHPNDEIRAKALQQIRVNYHKFTDSEKSTINDLMSVRLLDDSRVICEEILRFDFDVLKLIYGVEQLEAFVLRVFDRDILRDSKLIVEAVRIYGQIAKIDGNFGNYKYLINIFHLIVPIKNDKHCLKIATTVLESFHEVFAWLNVIKHAIKGVETDRISEIVEGCFNSFDGPVISLIRVALNERPVNVASKLNLILFFTAALPNVSLPEISVEILDVTRKMIDGVKIVSKKTNLQTYVKSAYQNELPLQCVLNLYFVLIAKTDFIGWEMNQNVDLARPSGVVLFIKKMMIIILNGVGDSIEKPAEKVDKKLYRDILETLFTKITTSLVERVKFLGNFFIAHEYGHDDDDVKLQQQCLRLTRKILLDLGVKNLVNNFDDIFTIDNNYFIVNLLISFMSDCETTRENAVNILEQLVETVKLIKTNESNDYSDFLVELNDHKHEILLDNEQISLILYTILSKNDKSNGKILDALICMSKQNNPKYFTSALFKLLKFFDEKSIIFRQSSVILSILSTKNDSDNVLDVHETNILRAFTSKINANLLRELCDDFWGIIVNGLSKFNMFVMDKNIQKPVTIEFIRIFNNENYSILNEKYQRQLIETVVSITTQAENMDISNAALKLIKQIHLDLRVVVPILDKMAKSDVKKVLQQRRRRLVTTTPAIETLDLNEWKNGITTLEFLQNKKKIENVQTAIATLFDLLKKCLEFEEQSALEYAKQLILTCILNASQKCEYLNENTLNIELVVQCIRGTQNPQTHHHALLVMSEMARWAPKHVLHHIMAVFTFMGSSVLRHDDAYSFQIITKLIETIIPILTTTDQTLQKHPQNESVHSSIVQISEVLRVFADVILDVPVHRRIPLYTKLLNTLGCEYMYLFVMVVFEGHVLDASARKNDVAEFQLPRRLGVGFSILMEYSADVVLDTCVKLLRFLNELPLDVKDMKKPDTFIKVTTQKQLRHLKYTIVTFIATVTSSTNFLAKVHEQHLLESSFKSMIIAALSCIQSISRLTNANTKHSQTSDEKYWKVILHNCFDILNNVNALLSPDMFLLVVKNLLTHNIAMIRRKAMELLVSRLQKQTFDGEKLFNLVDSIVNIVMTIQNNPDSNEGVTEELPNQQTALLTLQLISKQLLCADPPIHVDEFKAILKIISDLLAVNINKNTSVLASLTLCLAELVQNLKKHAIPNLNDYVPALLTILKEQKQRDMPDLVTLSVLKALQRVVETLPMFINAYLKKILYELSILRVKWTQTTSMVSAITTKVDGIFEKISELVAVNVLIGPVKSTCEKLLKKSYLDAVRVTISALRDALKNIKNIKTINHDDFYNFFLQMLDVRQNTKNFDIEKIRDVELSVMHALNAFVLKLSETSFRTFFYKFFDWANRDAARFVTFYATTNEFALNLKGLFILFAGHFIQNVAELLDKNNVIKTRAKIDEELTVNILNTLTSIFTFDSSNFVNKERFDVLMQPIVDQLENTFEDPDVYKTFVRVRVIPCIVNFATSISDDSLWKILNYQILLKTRHEAAHVRMMALECVVALATKLREDFLPYLPETVPFLAELLEDENEDVEKACQTAVQELEKALGESIRSYL